MNRSLTLMCLLLCGLSAQAATDARPADAAGWHWYNDPQDDNDEVPPPAAPTQSLTPSEQKAVLQKATKAALDTAILYPTPQNFKRYMTLQRFWTDKASEFTQSGKQALLMYPELDYNLQYSHYNGTVKQQLAEDKKKEDRAIGELSAKYGVFFFYRGQEMQDAQLALVIKDFAKDRHIALVPVSVDGVLNPLFPNSRIDRGQSQKMGISHFPALFLVNPTDESYQPLAYGFITQDDLARQFLNVASGFKANY